ncbi:hypothetical protein B0H34DRAFT_650799 [Crassisporium funariophilum]|nr:hypothetical protein B0H34DRAFT_650799 [Crassisporium funariophilum]
MDANDFLSADVPDPTDFPPTTSAPGLRNLDASLRCGICGELFDGPVTLPCGHCFCSVCIRPSMAIKQECPNCRKAANEGHLRPNPILEEAILAWNEARPFILQLLKQKEQSNAMGYSIDKGAAKKRKRSTERSSVQTSVGNVAGPSRIPASPTKSPKSPSKSKRFKSSSDFEDVIEITVPSSDVDEDEIALNHSNINPKPNDFVQCPMCDKRIMFKKLNIHLDNECKDPPSADNASKTWSKIMSGSKSGQHKGKHKQSSDDDYPLPKASYGTLKDRQLKELLSEQGLSVIGDRSNLEQRHQHWVVLYNSNLDRSLPNRKTKSELRRELKKWEEVMSNKKKIVVDDVEEYQIIHKSEFSRLIKAARPNKGTARTGSADSSSAPNSSFTSPMPTKHPTPPPSTISSGMLS